MGLTLAKQELSWGTLTMHLTRPAHNVHFLTSVVLLSALVVAIAAQTRDSPTLVLDLPKPVPHEKQLSAMPGASVTASEGRPLLRGYPLPLEVQLQFISPQPVRRPDKFTVEVLLRNTGDTSFNLPASQSSARVLKQGNKGGAPSSSSLYLRIRRTVGRPRK